MVAQAHRLVDLGLRDAGYKYFNLDGTSWRDGVRIGGMVWLYLLNKHKHSYTQMHGPLPTVTLLGASLLIVHASPRVYKH